MAKNRGKDDTETVVNYAGPGSVVGIQCGGSVTGSTVVVNGGGRWLDLDDDNDDNDD